nr:CPBP family intramembrane glutamic endopeptidase [Kocuria rhizophila]
MWGRAVPAAALVLVNALVFGLIHVTKVDGHWLLTLSYAGAGLVMNLVYLWTHNIWHVLLMHALNNFLLGGPLTVLLVKLLSDAVG